MQARLKVVLCWHMHQPEYRDLCGIYQQPWTYLHVIKDYVDMAAILEQSPGACAVVNFAPILLEQIADYAKQVSHFLEGKGCIRDPLLACLDMPSLPVRPEERVTLIKACLRANEKRLIDRYAPFRRLADMAAWTINEPQSMPYLDEQYLADLLVWYHLAWLGETVRRENTRAQQLIEKGSMFTLKDRRDLLEVIGELLASVLDRYRVLAERGQIELSMTPYAHPMLPLMLDFKSAREAMPEVNLPDSECYPGAKERSEWHIRQGIDTFNHYFGITPRGCWPAEGGVNDETLALLAKNNFTWVASGETVLRNSLAHTRIMQDSSIEEGMHRVYRAGSNGPASFFRDDGLSDLIGFTYADWHGDDAVNNFIHHLENIAENCGEHCPDRVVSIILDGENAWESYPENGYHFLSELYKKLAAHPRLELTTFSACLEQGVQLTELPSVVAGSWVYGTFSTWLGDDDKNRGWDLLCEVKHAYDAAVSSGKLTGEKLKHAQKQLAICEGSDWFWWFGDYNPSETVRDFEHLYRLHLSNLYQLIGHEPPEHLTQVISHGGGKPELGGVMRTGQAQAG